MGMSSLRKATKPLPMRQSILINLDKWKYYHGKELGRHLLSMSPGIKKNALPFYRFGHCIAKLNKTFIYLIGGHDEYNQYVSDLVTFDSKSSNFTTIKINEILCEPWKIGYQSTCAIYVRSCPELAP